MEICQKKSRVALAAVSGPLVPTGGLSAQVTWPGKFCVQFCLTAGVDSTPILRFGHFIIHSNTNTVYVYCCLHTVTLSTTTVVSPCQLFTSPAPLYYNTVYNVHTLYAIQHWSHLSVSIISKKSETKWISKVKLNGKCTCIKMYKKQFTPEYLSTCQRWDL